VVTPLDGKDVMKVILSSLVAGTVLILNLAVAKDSPDAPPMAPMALNSYTSVPGNIAKASVLDLNGDVIGRVQKLDLDQSGKPQGLEVALSGSEHVINVVAYNVSYDEQQNVVTVGLDKNQVSQMSQAPRN
jgi:hypothetical protein